MYSRSAGKNDGMKIRLHFFEGKTKNKNRRAAGRSYILRRVSALKHFVLNKVFVAALAESMNGSLSLSTISRMYTFI